MREEGIDILGMESKHLTEELVEGADLVFTMTKRYRDEILSRHLKSKHKVVTLREVA